MTTNAKKVWAVAVEHGIADAVEYCITDMEAFASGLDCDNKNEVLQALYHAIVIQKA